MENKMEIIFNPLQDPISSVIFKTDLSTVICSIYFVQKTEQEPFLQVIFNTEEIDETQEIIRDVIYKSIENKNAVTQFQIYFYIINTGPDSLSACINAYSICSILANINTNLLSSSYLSNCTMVYQLGSDSCINFYSKLIQEDLLHSFDKCLAGCKKTGKILENKIKEFMI